MDNKKIGLGKLKRSKQIKKLRLTRKGQLVFSIIIFVFLIILLCICFALRSPVKEDFYEFSYSETIPTEASFYFRGDSQEILDEEALSFDGIGEFERIVLYNEKEYTLNFHIIDDIEPLITIADEINIGLEFSEEDIFTIQDISEYSVETNLEIDKLVVGETSITVTATDVYGNKSTLTKTVNIVDEAHVSNVRIKLDINITDDIDSIITSYREKRNLNTKNFAMAYYHTGTKETYYYNEEAWRIGGSIYKVPLNMLFYELKNQQVLSNESTLRYCSNCYEAGGGFTAQSYNVGNQVPLEFLQTQSIVNSDNTASHILFEYFGYDTYRKQIQKYSDQSYPNIFLKDNTFNARYMLDTMKYLYEHGDEYEELITLMKQAMPNRYFKTYIKNFEIAHKYGEYLGNQNDVGIIYTPSPFILVVLSNNEQVSAEVADIMTEYTIKQ